MATRRFSWSVLPLALAFVALGGCGTTLTNLNSVTPTALVEAQEVPPASAFKTVEGSVTQLLPDDTSGLTHQNFVIQVTVNGKLKTYTVNNSTSHGQEVKGLKVGDKLTVRGTTYVNGAKNGLHWTHHANVPGDAGYIKTADGRIYE